MYSPQVLISLTSESKSQIAIEYAYRLQKKWPARSVFWVQANNAARLEQSYRSIATAAKIPGIEDPKVDVLDLVFQWLGSDQSGDWLLILDNADDADQFFGPPAAPETQTDAGTEPPRLSRFLPQIGFGSILITSRDEGTAIRLTGGQKQVLRVDVMSEDYTIALLTKKLPEDLSDESAKKALIIELDSVPLAITQASAYITVQGSRMTVARYLHFLRHDEKNQIDLLSKNEVDLRRDPGVPSSVIRTWQISFNQIKDQNPGAADLLSCMCMLDRQGIPEFLFCEDDKQSLEFEDAIGVLTRFSFLVKEKDRKGFAIHRLVQLATRKWNETYGEVERVQKEALRLVSKNYPNGEHRNWKTCEALEPHAQIVLNYIYDSAECKLQQSQILYNGAHYAWKQGRFKVLEEMIQKAIDIRRAYLDSEDPLILSSLSLLALTYRNQGRWSEAEKLNLKVLEMLKRVLGAKHPDTLTSLSNLAIVYQTQGRLTEAEKLKIQVLETRMRVLGAEHPDTLMSSSNLAEIYQAQGRLVEAEKLGVQILEIKTRVLGAEHPSTLISSSNLATIYWTQGRLAEAEKLNIQVLKTKTRVLGAEHPDTLTSLSNLVITYRTQGRLAEAEKLNIQVLETKTRVLGAEHPDTLTSLSSLATTYWTQGRLAEAEILKAQVLKTRTRVLGAEHPDTLISSSNLAEIYQAQGRLAETENLKVQVLETRARVLGVEHPDTLSSSSNLATTYQTQGRSTEAEKLEVQVLETTTRVLGAQNPATLTTMHNLACTYHIQDRHSEAIELMEKAVELRKRILGANHPNTINSIDHLARWTNIRDQT